MISERILDIDSLPFYEEDKTQLRKLVEYIQSSKIFDGVETYIFGSYVKGSIKNTSDIDILMLSEDDNLRNLRKLKLEIMEYLIEDLDMYLGEDYDLLIYNKSKFEEYCLKENSFEALINSYMCLVERG